MQINIKLDKNFTTAFNKLCEEYGENLQKLNGFSDSQLNYTDFIDNFIDKNVKTVADASIDGNANASTRDITSLEIEMSKPHSKLLAFNKIFFELNKKYGYIDDKYMTIIEAMVPYSSFVSDILVGFSEQTEFDLVLLNGDNSIMAMTTISYSYLNRIAPGTQMLIEWRMYVANPDKTTTQGE